MTFAEAVKELCLECKQPLKWSGFKAFEYQARCCGYQYTLLPKAVEYEFTVSRAKPEPPLFWHPV